MPEPMAELHVHLEGTIRHRTAVELALTHGLPPPPAYDYSSLQGFLAIYQEVAASARTAADLERVVLEHGEAMARQGITYAEVSFNSSLHAGDGWIDGIVSGRHRVAEHFGVEIAWLVELVRGAPDAQSRRAIDLALETEGVVGIGLVGDEAVPALPLLPFIERARQHGLGFMPHAGQSAGPELVWESLDALGATRIAHGLSAAGDESLMAELAQRDVCLCVCPSSNARIGLRPDFRKLAEHGVPLTINTDDPAMVPTTLERELDLASSRYGLDRAKLVAAAWSHRFEGRS
jgi:adenosine deaminase